MKELIKIMKKIFVIISLFFVVKTNFAQNKKEQIVILQNRIDSIKTVYENEILNKKNLSSYIDSITKLIVNEYKRIKDIEELNKKLKNSIDINNKEYDSLQSIIQKYNTQILIVKKELIQMTEALKKEKEENENDSKQKIDLSISKNINDITIDSSTFKNGNKIPEENKLPVNSKKLYYVRGKFKDIEWGDFAHYLFHRNDGQSIYFWHSDVLNRFRLEDDSPNTQLKDKMFDIFFSVENINLNPESDEIKDFHKFYVVKKIIPIR
jgi:hypothetical protein